MTNTTRTPAPWSTHAEQAIDLLREAATTTGSEDNRLTLQEAMEHITALGNSEAALAAAGVAARESLSGRPAIGHLTKALRHRQQAERAALRADAAHPHRTPTTAVLTSELEELQLRATELTTRITALYSTRNPPQASEGLMRENTELGMANLELKAENEKLRAETLRLEQDNKRLKNENQRIREAIKAQEEAHRELYRTSDALSDAIARGDEAEEIRLTDEWNAAGDKAVEIDKHVRALAAMGDADRRPE